MEGTDEDLMIDVDEEDEEDLSLEDEMNEDDLDEDEKVPKHIRDLIERASANGEADLGSECDVKITKISNGVKSGTAVRNSRKRKKL